MDTQKPKSAPKPAPKPAIVEDDHDAEDRLFRALWDGDLDGEVFDGDPADLW